MHNAIKHRFYPQKIDSGEIANNNYTKVWGVKEVCYGICASREYVIRNINNQLMFNRVIRVFKRNNLIDNNNNNNTNNNNNNNVYLCLCSWRSIQQLDSQEWENSVASGLHREFYGGLCFVKQTNTIRRSWALTPGRSQGYSTKKRMLMSIFRIYLPMIYSFCQKLVLYRGLKFAFLRRVSSIEAEAIFKKAYRSLEPHLGNDDLKELAVATLRSVALNYIQRKVQKPSKTLLPAIEKLKQREDIAITKPDKGSGVVVMDKPDLHLSSSCKYKRRGRTMLNIQYSPRVQPVVIIICKQKL